MTTITKRNNKVAGDNIIDFIHIHNLSHYNKLGDLTIRRYQVNWRRYILFTLVNFFAILVTHHLA